MNKLKYVDKTMSLLGESKFLKSNIDTTKKFQCALSKALNNTKTLLSSKEKFLWKNLNPQALTLYSLVKLHKQGNTFSLVVSYITNLPNRLSA